MSDFIHELKNDHRVIQQVVAGMSAVAELLPTTQFPLGAVAAVTRLRRMLSANSLISVRSRCISLQPYHIA